MKNLSEILNEEKDKSPEEMEMEHTNTAEWFAKEIIGAFQTNQEESDDNRRFDRDRLKEDIKKLLPEYFKRIVQDHKNEFKNYYDFLVWLEDQMKKYKTVEEMINAIKGNK